MKGNEGGIFIKAPNWMSLFLLKIKIKQNPGYPDKEYNVIFKHIHQNNRVYYRNKKIFMDQWLWKCYYLFRRVRAKWDVCKQVRFVPNTFGGVGDQCHLKKIWLLLLSLKLGNSIPCTWTDTNCFINVNISFSRQLVI